MHAAGGDDGVADGACDHGTVQAEDRGRVARKREAVKSYPSPHEKCKAGAVGAVRLHARMELPKSRLWGAG